MGLSPFRPAHRLFSKQDFYKRLSNNLESLKTFGLYKEEQVICSPQESQVVLGTLTTNHSKVINFCSNNYLGLSNHPEIIKAGEDSIKSRGAGMSSVRFICGTQDLHKELESRLSSFHNTEDTILYTSCFDANAGIFEAILGPEDAVISDTLNHASIIDGIRLCKAQRLRYKHNDMDDLEKVLLENTFKSRTMLIVTDGVFSMDGDLANLPKICELAEKYSSLVMVDDSHATGLVGATGRGTVEYFGVKDRVDIICSTLGKALGGSSGGYTTGRAELVATLRQKSRPYLFSNSVPPVIAAFAMKAIELVDSYPELRKALLENTLYFRKRMSQEGYKLMGNNNHPICPVLVGDAVLASKMAQRLRERGIYVTAFSFPVVPQDTARIRVQISAGHTPKQIDLAVKEFASIGKEYSIV